MRITRRQLSEMIARFTEEDGILSEGLYDVFTSAGVAWNTVRPLSVRKKIGKLVGLSDSDIAAIGSASGNNKLEAALQGKDIKALAAQALGEAAPGEGEASTKPAEPAPEEAPAEEEQAPSGRSVPGGEEGGLQQGMMKSTRHAEGKKTKKFGGKLKQFVALEELNPATSGRYSDAKAYKDLVQTKNAPGSVGAGSSDRGDGDYITKVYVHFNTPSPVTAESIMSGNVRQIYFEIGRSGARGVKDYRGVQSWAKKLAAALIFGEGIRNQDPENPS